MTYFQKLRAEAILKISLICESKEAEYLNPEAYVNQKSLALIQCSCGGTKEIPAKDIASGNSYPRCEECAQLEYARTNREWVRANDLPRLKERIEYWGCTLVEDTYVNRKTPFECLCKCGVKFITKDTKGNLWKKAGERVILCESCAKTHKWEVAPRGENHPKWNHNATQEERKLRDFRKIRDRQNDWYSSWAFEVKRAAGFKCVITGKPSKNLTSHHLYNWANFPELRIFTTNGVCIERSLHDEFHAIYGKGHNTYSQFSEFYLYKTGESLPIEDLYLKIYGKEYDGKSNQDFNNSRSIRAEIEGKRV